MSAVIKVELNPMQQMDFDAWQQELGKVAQITQATPWIVGQLWLYGKKEWPEKVKAALPPGYASDKLERAAKVCEAFPESERINGLTFEHHAVVLSDEVPINKRKHHLLLAKFQGWSAKQLKDHINPKLIDVEQKKRLTAKHRQFVDSIQAEGAHNQRFIKAEVGESIFDIDLDAPPQDVVEVLRDLVTAILEAR